MFFFLNASAFCYVKLNSTQYLGSHLVYSRPCAIFSSLLPLFPTHLTDTASILLSITGKIIPAIATTTAMVTGLVCLELYKVIQSKPLSQYFNSWINLSLPVFTTSEPGQPDKKKAKIKGKDWEWSAWDRIDINEGDITLQQFMDLMQVCSCS